MYLYKKDFEEKADEFSERFNIPFGRVYETMTGVKFAYLSRRPLRHPLQLLFDNKVFYRNVYVISANRLKTLNDSGLERIASERK